MTVTETDLTTNYNESDDLFERLGKYYGILFGIALILITFAHIKKVALMGSSYADVFPDNFISISNFFGEVGVKMFFFMAGFGAYHSLNKRPEALGFYARRARRMFPYYYTLVIAMIIYYKPPFDAIAGNIFLTGWWMNYNSQFFWFHQTIYIIYLLAPILFSVITQTKKHLMQLFFIWLFFIGASMVFPEEMKTQGVQVIPLFATGMLFCKYALEGIKIKKIHTNLLLLAGLFSSVILFSTNKFIGILNSPGTLPHLFMSMASISLCLGIVTLMAFIEKKREVNQKYKDFLLLIGKRALEIYLIQVILLSTVNGIENPGSKILIMLSKIGDTQTMLLVSALSLVGILILSFPIGILYGKAIDKAFELAINFYNNHKFSTKKVIITLLALAIGGGVYFKVNENPYSKDRNWLALPKVNVEKPDVIYLYPNVCTIEIYDRPDKCTLNNKTMRKYALNDFKDSPIVKAFKNVANVYVPFYPQIDYSLLSSELEQQRQNAEDIRTKNYMMLEQSLDYYFEHYNNGRPYILVTSKQGEDTMLTLLSEYMGGHQDNYYKKMVATYIIGAPIDNGYISENPHLKFAESNEDTGVIVNSDKLDEKMVKNITRRIAAYKKQYGG